MVTDSVVSTLLVPMCGSLLSYPCKCSSFVVCELYFQKQTCSNICHYQNAGQNRSVRLGNTYCETVAKFRYLFYQ